MLAAVRDLPDMEVRSLYDLYPDFDIDVATEQAALVRADRVVWLHPVYWYSVPSMLKHWFDVVLLRGFAYGDGGTALAGKPCLWVPTAGGDAAGDVCCPREQRQVAARQGVRARLALWGGEERRPPGGAPWRAS